MAEECADCGATFGSPAELVRHVEHDHHGGDAVASMEMNPESDTQGLVCALCGRRFADRNALAHHNLKPHYRGNRRAGPAPATG
ncbi:MAG TPA: C2H2-type zinc finger protein [Thermoplasmata archaeon]|nr:C2H2-type zinc finger protein [Thermoplasmata archaeon]